MHYSNGGPESQDVGYRPCVEVDSASLRVMSGEREREGEDTFTQEELTDKSTHTYLASNLHRRAISRPASADGVHNYTRHSDP